MRLLFPLPEHSPQMPPWLAPSSHSRLTSHVTFEVPSLARPPSSAHPTVPRGSLRFLSCVLLLPGVLLFICLVACLPAARTYSAWEQEPHGTAYCSIPGACRNPAHGRSPATLSEGMMPNVIRVSQQQADRSTGVYQVKGGPAGNPDWGLGGHIHKQ